MSVWINLFRWSSFPPSFSHPLLKECDLSWDPQLWVPGPPSSSLLVVSKIFPWSLPVWRFYVVFTMFSTAALTVLSPTGFHWSQPSMQHFKRNVATRRTLNTANLLFGHSICLSTLLPESVVESNKKSRGIGARRDASPGQGTSQSHCFHICKEKVTAFDWRLKNT
jgi:hypothetical protein